MADILTPGSGARRLLLISIKASQSAGCCMCGKERHADDKGRRAALATGMFRGRLVVE